MQGRMLMLRKKPDIKISYSVILISRCYGLLLLIEKYKR